MNYISFDMGSESMAAFCQLKNDPEGFNIDLQEYAQELLGKDTKEKDISYLWKYKKGEKVKSSRLRTLISLEEDRQPVDLTKNHAKLNFIDSKGNATTTKSGTKVYDQSLFGFFYLEDQGLARKVIPNPKIPFQEGAGKVIPLVKSTNGEKIRHQPETLIHHLMSQVILNLVLKSSKLRNRRIRKDDIHLIMTIPNVYSLSHAQSIEKFIKECVSIGNVETLYESDAVAYYILDKKLDIREFDKFNEERERKKKDKYQILTFDIGHGTTDLSLIEITKPEKDDLAALEGEEEDKSMQFFVKARTGKSEGGSRLNYILAEYYNNRLKEILNQEEFYLFKKSFNFLEVEGEMSEEQAQILERLEELINKVKKSMNARYEVELSVQEQSKYINDIVKKWLDALFLTWSKEDKKARESLCAQFKSQLKQAFILKKLPGSFKSFFCDILCNTLNLPFFFPETRKFVSLKKNIQDYVKGNVVDTLKQLDEMALARENVDVRKKKRTILAHIPTFAVIAGQASQFKPIQKAIKKELKDRNIPTDYQLFLKGETAKEACCRGAVTYKKSSHKWMNPEEIHGTYGFLNEIEGEDVCLVLDTKDLNEGETIRKEFNYLSTYWLFYTPRAHHTITKDNYPKFFDNATALIASFERQNLFEVFFDDKKLSIVVNGKSGFKIATYGDIYESIYPKVWPVYLKPIKK